MEVMTLEAGYTKVIDLMISKGSKIINLFMINRNRYIIVKAEPETALVVFKRDFFNSFGKMFQSEGESGIGDTINVEDLRCAIQSGATKIYAIFPDGKIYSISIQEFLVNSHKWLNKEGKEVRSISIHKYSREN